jgi:cellulose synthase operon protein C
VEPTPQERLFAMEVKRAQAAANVSQNWIGQQIGLSRGKISEICSGKYLPTYDTVIQLVAALTMDRERTVGLWRDARAGNAVRRGEERRERTAAQAVTEWDRLPVLPTEIVSLLRAQEFAAGELPYRLPGAKRPSLSAVYVRQDLGQPVDDALAESRTDEVLPLALQVTDSVHRMLSFERAAHQAPRPSRPVRLPGRTVRAALDGDDHLLITGGPGQGKSTLTLRLAADIAQVWLDPSATGDAPLAEPIVPLRLTARELAAHLDVPLPEALARSVAAEFGPSLKAEVPAYLFAGRVAGCRWLLLVDAVDEVVDRDQQDRLLRALAHWATEQPDRSYRFVVTSRPLGGAGLAPLQRVGAARYELQPFDAEALRRFAGHWFTADKAPDGELLSRRFLTQIRQTHLEELVRVPLMATIAAIIFEQHRDRPLPDNKYDLYETYLDYLARRGTAQSRFASVLRELRSGLLEHLGVTRLATTGSLAKSACSWIAEQVSADHLPLGWRADVVTYLTTAGPTIVRRDDVEFLHHSFADHLAATAHARELPVPFAAEHPEWKEALHAARSNFTRTNAEAVLVHCGHLHPDQGDAIVRWLHDNTAGFQLVAARLLAQHMPATAETIDGFLTTVWAWARTSDWPGQGIVEEASKATNHRPLATWLRALMRDSDATWASRIHAATVLCTLFDAEDRAEAPDLLLAALRDPALEVSNRVTAAECLAELGVQGRSAAEAGLRAVLADAAIDGETLRTAAIALADLGAEARAYAVSRIQAALADPATPAADLSSAAVGLVEIGPEFDGQAAAILRTLVRETNHLDLARLGAALALGRLGPLYVDEAAALIESIINDHRLNAFHRSVAAGTLAELGPEYVPLAADHITGLLDRPDTDESIKSLLVSDLASLGPAFRSKAAAYLRGTLTNPANDAGTRLSTIETLAKLSAEFHADAAVEYRRLWSDILATEYTRCKALEHLAELGPQHREEATELLAGAATDTTASPRRRLAATLALSRLDVRLHAVAREVLRALMSDDSIDGDLRVEAASSLAGLGSRFHPEIVTVLRPLLRESASGPLQLSDAFEVAELGNVLHDEVVSVLRRLFNDASLDVPARVSAARQLAEVEPACRSEAADALYALLDVSRENSAYLSDVCVALAPLGSDTRQKAAMRIRDLLLDRSADAERRQHLAEALAALGDEYQTEAAEAMRTNFTAPATDDDLRVKIGTALCDLVPEHRSAIIPQLSALLRNQRIHPLTRSRLAARLATLGPNPRDEAISVLRTMLADATVGGFGRQYAAVTLSRLGWEFHEEAATELRRITCDRDEPAPTRVRAAWELTALLRSSQSETTTCLLEIAADPAQSIADRCDAAQKLVRLDREHWPRAVQELRAAMTSPLIKPTDALTITASLNRLNAITDGEERFIVVAVANDPTATASERRAAIDMMDDSPRYWGDLRILLRALLLERTASIGERVPYTAELAGVAAPLIAEVRAAIQETLSSPEFDADDKISALRELALLGDGHREDAATALRAMIDSPASSWHAAIAALGALANFGGQFCLEAWQIADGIQADEAKPFAARLAAAKIGLYGKDPRPHVIEFLLRTLRDHPLPSIRADAASTLLDLGPEWRAEAVGELRRLLQNSQINAYVRLEAAKGLARWSPLDRHATLTVVDALASDSTSRPALRLEAAEMLVQQGVGYRDAAVAHLRALVDDPAIVASARLNAVNALTEIDSRYAARVIRVVRTIAADGTIHPVTQVGVLNTLGGLGRTHTHDAVAALHDLARDTHASPTVRWKAAYSMAYLHRGARDEAALIIRDVVRSASVPAHIRWNAARVLARLSPTCRDEALEHLAALASARW